MNIKNIIVAATTSTVLATTAFADITVVVPQKPGAGTTVWAEIVMKELEKKLNEDITLRLIPGARDIPGFNEFHNTLRFDEETLMVSHGGNGVSFLQENVDYNYADYESIGLMNLNIIAGKRVGDDMSASEILGWQWTNSRSICYDYVIMLAQTKQLMNMYLVLQKKLSGLRA